MVHNYQILSKFSPKQEAYAHYLLTALGHDAGEDTENYIEVLQKKSFQYRDAGNRKIVEEEKQDYYFLQDDVWMKERYTMIDFLHDEYQIKKHNKYKLKKSIYGYITATDLANYVFCPVGYSIGRTFQGVSIKGAITGKEFHELSILNQKKNDDKVNTSYESSGLCNDSNRSFFKDLISSQLTYAGHDAKNINYFVNEERKFAGDPDYVFTNASGSNYIVEEKFINEANRKHTCFYRNHKVQLASYIKYLQNFNAQYGYLVYWIYSDNSGERSIVGCEVLKITLDDRASAWLENVMAEVENLRVTKTKIISFEALNPNKCGSCVHSMYCGHKNKKHKEVTYPYDIAYHKQYPADFPKILKKDRKSIATSINDN